LNGGISLTVPDRGCTEEGAPAGQDPFERAAFLPCDDGLDDDGDG
jgi:hypothetical protein